MERPAERDRDLPLPGLVLAALLGHTLLSAGTHLAAKRATVELDPLLLVVLRLTIAALLFVVVLVVTPGARLPPRREWGTFMLFGFLAGPMNQGLFLWGVRESNATHAALLYALTPIGVYLGSLLLRRERARPRRLWGAALAFTGVSVLLLLGGGLVASARGNAWFGDLAILGAVLVWVAWTIEGRRLSATYGGLRTAAWAMIAGGLWAVPALPFVVRPAELGDVSAAAWSCLAYLIVLTSVVSYVLWNASLARVEASRVAVFTNLQPVATAFAAWLIIGEHLGPETFAGGALVLVGVRLAQT